jgi:molecular chaperone DnaK
MPYSLGVDLGTTYTAAAVRRDGRSEIVALQHSESVIPSVVFFGEDGAIVTGEPANQRALSRPERVAREFKRRTGDPTPLQVAGHDHTVEALTADLLRWVIRAVTQQQGEVAGAIALCHPANWGPHKVDALSATARLARVNVAAFISEPEAAAIHYSTQERVESGSVVAVYDLGGGTFDATVLRKTPSGFELLGQPRGVDQLGGIDFDELVFRHVIQAVGSAFAELDPDDPLAMAAVSRLRRECTRAKEFLSSDNVALIPVLLPNAQAEVRLTRGEFEAMIRPLLAQSIDALQAALQAAQVQPSDVDTVLLVGGSSRIPLVSQLVQSSLGRPVAIDVHTKHAVALGASIAAEMSGFQGRVSDDPGLLEISEATYLGKSPPLPYSDDDHVGVHVGAPPPPPAHGSPSGAWPVAGQPGAPYVPAPPVAPQFPYGQSGQYPAAAPEVAPSTDERGPGGDDEHKRRRFRRKK